MPSEKIKNYCRECGRITNHAVLSKHSESYRDDYHCNINYQIVECRGCETKSFRKIFTDFEAAYPTYDDEWEVPEEITIYPKFIEGHSEIQDTYRLPIAINDIYSEVLLTLKEDAKILAGLGLRTTVEAICNDLNISGKNLSIRINKLVTEGYISKNDAERLHGIRFMGNDAAHDIKAPKEESLSVALQIIEHLIISVYILEARINGNIDTSISKYKEFKKILNEKLNEFNKGDEFPIAKLVGKDLRRVQESIATLEQELIADIQNGTYQKLLVGRVDNYQNSPNKLQYFIVN